MNRWGQTLFDGLLLAGFALLLFSFPKEIGFALLALDQPVDICPVHPYDQAAEKIADQNGEQVFPVHKVVEEAEGTCGQNAAQ